MCGRIIQKSGPFRLAIVEGLGVSDSRMGNILPRYNAAPSHGIEAAHGTTQTLNSTQSMSAFGGKADISDRLADVRQ